MPVDGVVREWHSDAGWGVIESPETPGGCWTHFAQIAARGYRVLSAGQAVNLEWELADQDGYQFRAVRVWPAGSDPVAQTADGDSAAFSSTLTVRCDDRFRPGPEELAFGTRPGSVRRDTLHVVPAEKSSPATSGALWSAAFAGASVDSMRPYDTIIARLFTPWAHDLVERLAPPTGCAALDIACGPGTVTRILAERIGSDGHVVATDISPAMLDIARSKPVAAGKAPIEWLCAPAAPLPLPDAAFDVVCCQQGLQFFPNKLSALTEMRRVLRIGGRAGVAVWTQVEEQLFGYLRDAIANVVSAELAERYLGPFLLSGDDAAEYAHQAGFENVTLQKVTLPAVLHGGAQELFDTLPAAGIAPAIAALDDAKRAELLAETVRLTEPLRDGAALHGSLASSVLILS